MVLTVKCDAVITVPAQRILTSGIKKGEHKKGYRSTGNGWGVSLMRSEVFVCITADSKPLQLPVGEELREFFDGRLTAKRIGRFIAAMPESIRVDVAKDGTVSLRSDDLRDWMSRISS